MTAVAARPVFLGGIVFALAAALIYGAVPNFARLAFLNGVPALESVFYRTTAVALVFCAIAALRQERMVLSRQAMPAFLLQTLATFLVSSCYLASLQFLPVTLSVIIFYTFPMIILLAAPLIEGHFPGWIRLLVAGFGFAGLFVAVGPVFEQFDSVGLILAALGALGCALQFFSGRMLSRHLTPAAFGSLVHLAIWPVILVLALYFGGGQLQLFAGGALGPWALPSVVLVCLAYIGGYFFHMSAVKAAPSSVVAPYFNVEPIVSTSFAVFLLGESMTWNQAIGGVMIFTALLVSSFLPNGKRT